MSDKVLDALRGMAWERAKGELNSLATASYPSEHTTPKGWDDWAEKCNRRREVIDSFIKTMQDEELYLA